TCRRSTRTRTSTRPRSPRRRGDDRPRDRSGDRDDRLRRRRPGGRRRRFAGGVRRDPDGDERRAAAAAARDLRRDRRGHRSALARRRRRRGDLLREERSDDGRPRPRAGCDPARSHAPRPPGGRVLARRDQERDRRYGSSHERTGPVHGAAVAAFEVAAAAGRRGGRGRGCADALLRGNPGRRTGADAIRRDDAGKEASTHMISRIRGVLVERSIGAIEVMTPGGVGYQIEIPLGVYERLPREGEEVELRTYYLVREDGVTLYGFLDARERDLFGRLLTASGVGPRLALNMLSTLSPERLVRAIMEKDIASLRQVPGLGAKKAERLALELADKL